ncbi:MAG: hypothetical protein J6Y07_01090 [Alphaproteobacteria bacterium]|nr:hypothetical protein [Alphaproteobacteria bacterium]
MPYKKNNHKHVNDPIVEKKPGRLGVTVTRDEKLDDILRIINDKVTKLQKGETDQKKKAKLYEIATNNLEMYFKYGGTTERSVVDENEHVVKNSEGRVITAKDLKRFLETFQH